MDSMGHFSFSVRTQDVEDLKNVFWEKLNLDVALRWRTVQTKERFVKCDDRENAPAATQTLVSSTEVERAHKTL